MPDTHPTPEPDVPIELSVHREITNALTVISGLAQLIRRASILDRPLLLESRFAQIEQSARWVHAILSEQAYRKD